MAHGAVDKATGMAKTVTKKAGSLTKFLANKVKIVGDTFAEESPIAGTVAHVVGASLHTIVDSSKQRGHSLEAKVRKMGKKLEGAGKTVADGMEKARVSVEKVAKKAKEKAEKVAKSVKAAGEKTARNIESKDPRGK